MPFLMEKYYVFHLKSDNLLVGEVMTCDVTVHPQLNKSNAFSWYLVLRLCFEVSLTG